MTKKLLSYLPWRTLVANENGSVLLEFALGLPVLFVMLIGILDLGRYGLQKQSLLQGARAGAQYGMASPNDTANINLTAESATGLSGVVASSNKFCECVSGVSVGCTTKCTGGTNPKTYISVNTSRPFSSVLVGSLNFGAFGTWAPPVTVTGAVTMIVP